MDATSGVYSVMVVDPSTGASVPINAWLFSPTDGQAVAVVASTASFDPVQGSDFFSYGVGVVVAFFLIGFGFRMFFDMLRGRL